MKNGKKDTGEDKSSFKEFLTKPLLKTDSSIAQYSGLGITLAGTILVFVFIGLWLDGKFETGILFTLILSFIGFAAGFYSFILNVKKLSQKDKKKNPNFNKY
jgi:ATP synthase protein I